MQRSYLHRLLFLSTLCLSLLALGTACGDLDEGDGCDPEFEDCSEVVADDNNSSQDEPQDYEITVEDLTFSPKSLTITAGSTVTWDNTSTEQIAIAMQSAPSGASTEVSNFDMLLNPGESTVLTFRAVGTYRYHARNQTTFPGLQDAEIIVE
jgi:plastocyanin